MFTLVIGGAGSGKSALAEDLLLRSPGHPRIYLATLEVSGAESVQRVAREADCLLEVVCGQTICWNGAPP